MVGVGSMGAGEDRGRTRRLACERTVYMEESLERNIRSGRHMCEHDDSLRRVQIREGLRNT